jgi:quercetin dioxygenase-like cupin family protein
MAPAKPALESGNPSRCFGGLIPMRPSSGLLLAAVVIFSLLVPSAGRSAEVEERRVLDNERVTIYEYVFPAGFRGEEHAAVADEFAYVLEGEFTVVTRGRGKQVLRRGEVEYASKGTIHLSLNESKKPARVLVVLLKGRS